MLFPFHEGFSLKAPGVFYVTPQNIFVYCISHKTFSLQSFYFTAVVNVNSNSSLFYIFQPLPSVIIFQRSIHSISALSAMKNDLARHNLRFNLFCKHVTESLWTFQIIIDLLLNFFFAMTTENSNKSPFISVTMKKYLSFM